MRAGAVESGFDGSGDLLFHLFGGPAWFLRDNDFDERRRRVRISFDIESEECVGANREPHTKPEQHERTEFEQKVNEGAD